MYLNDYGSANSDRIPLTALNISLLSYFEHP